MQYFSYSDFKDINELVSLKRKKNITVGLGLPVRNEEKTLEKILSIIKKESNLIDKVIAVDSGSTDKSIQIFKKFNITIIKDEDIAHKLQINLERGKGWNLWASFNILDTDITAWIDTDIINFNKNFLRGIIGPLIKSDKIQFVKGYYQRPKNDARVTEIMARPLISCFYPQLDEIIQPLSGEYAGRKKFLKKIDFYSGYSIEMAILIQAANILKSDEMAQSFLGSRKHELQTVTSLGMMSSSILKTVLHFSERDNKIKLKKKISNYLYQYSSNDGINFKQVKNKTTDKKICKKAGAISTLKNFLG